MSEERRLAALAVLRERLPKLIVDLDTEHASAAGYICSWIGRYPDRFADFDRRRYAEPGMFEATYDEINTYTEGDLANCCARGDDFAFLFGMARSAYLIALGQEAR